jgi:hypothetical protein
MREELDHQRFTLVITTIVRRRHYIARSYKCTMDGDVACGVKYSGVYPRGPGRENRFCRTRQVTPAEPDAFDFAKTHGDDAVDAPRAWARQSDLVSIPGGTAHLPPFSRHKGGA